MNVNNMGVNELRLAVQSLRPYVAEVKRLREEVERLREALREAAEMSEHEQDRTLIYNHCSEAAEAGEEQ